MNREAFLHFVEEYVEQDPESAAFIANYVQAGLYKTLKETRERAADMEVAVAVLAAHRFKGKDEVVKTKLKKWKDKTSLNWNWLLNAEDE